jgi:hypothetical protein
MGNSSTTRCWAGAKAGMVSALYLVTASGTGFSIGERSCLGGEYRIKGQSGIRQ